MNYVLMNPLADNARGEQNARERTADVKNAEYRSVLDIPDMKAFFQSLRKDDVVILTGGDGTLNRLANSLRDYEPANDIYYIKAGSGNDFYNDNKHDEKDGRIHLNRYLKNLPVITVNGMERVFINGIGYGIDGEACRIGDIQRKTSTKPINYSLIAVKLLLGAYKKNRATITVDGKTERFEDVWFGSTMKGRYYGGGVMVAPAQDRFNENGTVSAVCLHKRSRLVTLLRFTSLFKGEHVKWPDWCRTVEGKEVHVEFDFPCALQIDGEVVPDVTSYTVRA